MKNNIKKSKHWSQSKNGIKAFSRHKKLYSEELKKERDDYKLIRDFEKGNSVILQYKDVLIKSYVIRVYDKSYKIALEKIDDKLDYVLIDKKTLTGYSNFTKSEMTGDSRRYVGEIYILKK